MFGIIKTFSTFVVSKRKNDNRPRRVPGKLLKTVLGGFSTNYY